MANNSGKFIVLSFDALGGADFETLQQYPVFKDFFEQGATCRSVVSVYPSVTYACHTSIVTGKHPKNHGIIANTKLQPNRVNEPDWYWQRKYIKRTTIYDEALKKGLKVATFLWPVTGKSNITYNLPEIFPNRKWDHQIFTSLRNGSPLYLLELFKNYRHLLRGIEQPHLDDFVTACVCHTIKTKPVDMLLVHFTDLDTARHDDGVRSPEALGAIERLAHRYMQIVNALKETGEYENSTIVILGDHYQLDYEMKVPLNDKLHDAGWLEVQNGKISTYEAMAKSNGGSAYIYGRPTTCLKSLRSFLEGLKTQKNLGIDRILTAKEAAEEGADPNCAFMLEAREGYVFTDWIGGGNKGKRADHGYHPIWKSNYETFFAMKGPGVKQGVRVEEMSLIDIAPTWAKLFGLELEGADGKVIEEMLL